MRLPWTKKKLTKRVSTEFAPYVIKELLWRHVDFSISYQEINLHSVGPTANDLFGFVLVTFNEDKFSQFDFAVDDARHKFLHSSPMETVQ